MYGLTIKEIRDLFLVQYRIQTRVRGLEYLELGEKTIAYWISAGQKKILEELRPAKSFIDIVCPKGVNTFTLPLDFGLDIKCELNGHDLVKMDITEMNSSGESAQGTIGAYAIYFDGGEDVWKITFAPEPMGEMVPRLWFYPEYGLYKPTLNKNQEWGKFDGATFEGYLHIPPTYEPLLITFLLSQAIPEMFADFNMEVIKYKQIQASQNKRKPRYKFGEKQ